MTIAELGSLGELIAAIATLGTLVYLAVQIHQNTASTKISASQSILASLNGVLSIAASTPQAAKVTILGQTDYDNLPEDEQAQFLVWLFSWFRVLEQAYFHYEKGFLDKGIWDGQVEHLKQVTKNPAVGRWWDARRSYLSVSFRNLVDDARIARTAATPPRALIRQTNAGRAT